MKRTILLIILFVLLSLCGIAHANVFHMGAGLTSLETVKVGNPGNTGEMSGNGGWAGPTRVCGRVDYNYRIGKYEVTTAQYCEFLNAVAKTDTYGLYNPEMAGAMGCQIYRSGTSGNYVYTMPSIEITPRSFQNRPVNFVSWADSARFVNWLHNGQPTGPQNNSTTEDGAYALNGKTSHEDLITITRKDGWKWAVASEDEWYKAAYHKNDGVTGNYWDYPTRSNSEPGRDFFGTNDANLENADGSVLIPYGYRNNVGEFINSPGPYGTFDQGGNVYERTDTVCLLSDGSLVRDNRGGSFWQAGNHYMLAEHRGIMYDPEFEHGSIGFRVVTEPGPDEGEVQIDNHGVLLVDGEPFLPIGYMGVSTVDMEAIAQIGGNTVHNYNAYYWTLEQSAQFMAEAARLNLKVVLPPWGSNEDCGRTTTSLTPEEITRITNQVNLYKNHPNFLAWYMSDEPEGQGIPASRLREAYQLVRSLDPYHPCIMLNDSIAGIETYKDTADIMMPDPYCQPTTTGFTRDMSLISGFMDQIELVAPDTVAMACLQAFDYGEFRDYLYTDRAPTLDEFRSMTWIAINHGCKGFIHFAWPYTFNYPDLYLGVPYVIKEVNALSGVVLSPNSRQVTAEGWNVGLDARVVEYNGATWVIVVNILNQTRDFSVVIPELGNSQLNVVGEDLTFQASNGRLSDTLQKYETRIYTTGNPNFSLRKAPVNTSIAALEMEKRKPGNFAFWMDNGTIVQASSWIHGNRFVAPRGVTNGVISQDEGWLDNNYSFPDWIKLAWSNPKVVGKVVLYAHNLQNFEIQYLNNGNWITVKSYVGDSALQQQSVITFPPVSTKEIRVLIHSAFGANSKISEIECYSEGNYTDPDIFNMGAGFTSLETVIVGNPGNIGEVSGNNGWAGPIRTCGAVDYMYKIGKYEVTAAQYTIFLNAVAKTDTYGLYNPEMQSNAEGCKIYRNGVSGSYTYAVANDWANRPVNYVSWADSARFVNWLHNGRPIGNQDNTTTEDGAYSLNGKTLHADLITIARKDGWKWAVASEDEWYKAAYHKNDGATGNYWDYPTKSNSEPGRDFNGTNDVNMQYPSGSLLIPNIYRNNAGEFINCPGPYGTFDQGGNVWERTDTVCLLSDGSLVRDNRGSSYRQSGNHYVLALNRGIMYDPEFEHGSIGFRVAAQVFGHPISGKIILANYNGDITKIPVTIDLGNGFDPITLYLDADGKFTILDVPDGTYNIRIKASHWLNKLISGIEVR